VNSTREAYDRVAEAYAAHFHDELADKPLDRALLNWFADETRGRVADVGCGPAQIGRYLQEKGLEVLAIDQSEPMLSHAKRACPALQTRRADMFHLPLEDGSLAGMVAFYAIVHLEAPALLPLFQEFHRVLQPGGRLLLSFHGGDERIRLDRWFERDVVIEWIFHDPEAVADQLTRARFQVDTRLIRAPYPSEHPSQRVYLSATS